MELISREVLVNHILLKIDEFSILALAILNKHFYQLFTSQEFISYLSLIFGIPNTFEYLSSDTIINIGYSLFELLVVRHNNSKIPTEIITKTSSGANVTNSNIEFRCVKVKPVFSDIESVAYRIKIREKYLTMSGTIRKGIVLLKRDNNIVPKLVNSGIELSFNSLKRKFAITGFVCLLSVGIYCKLRYPI
jgi:hypothetical protein